DRRVFRREMDRLQTSALRLRPLYNRLRTLLDRYNTMAGTNPGRAQLKSDYLRAIADLKVPLAELEATQIQPSAISPVLKQTGLQNYYNFQQAVKQVREFVDSDQDAFLTKLDTEQKTTLQAFDDLFNNDLMR